MSRLIEILQKMDRRASRAFPISGILNLSDSEDPRKYRRAVAAVVVLLIVVVLSAGALLRVQWATPPATRAPVSRRAEGEVFRTQLRQGLDAAQRGAFQEAVQRFERALELNATSVEVWNDLGVVLIRQGDLAGGVRALRRALELNASHAEAHRNLAVALEHQGDPAEAAEHYERFLSLSPENHPDRAEIRRRLAVVRQRSPQ